MTLDALAVQLRDALEARDLDALGALLTDDVRWGDGPQPRACRSRRDVLATFALLMQDGVEADVAETVVGPNGILYALRIRWPVANARRRRSELFQVYLIRNGLVFEIRGYDDRSSALAAIGVVSQP